MPRRTDIHSVLIIGTGPIVIGQACEFDYSGTQACKALREEGLRVVLANSNPATIMTDPEMADATYIEPITVPVLSKIIEAEKPDALLPTLGGQTGLNIAMQLAENGTLERHGVLMIGADREAIRKAEDRKLFKLSMEAIGLEVPRSGLAHSLEEARETARRIGFPLVIRPSFTLGGTGGGIVPSVDRFDEMASRGLSASMISEILVEESIAGWKEFELEVMRDTADNVVVVCSIENFDPMGIHTGDSITVAPAQTLTDREYQRMRDAAIACIREIGVETGGSNIQFAMHPGTGRMVVIEMNPRVSRSSALASKATGFPIARIAAKLAVGYTLDEIPNDITKDTPASFEPTIDYCVVKIPRFAFEKFPSADPTLTIQMKSVGEVMAIGRTFKEALQKGIRGLEIRRPGLSGSDGGVADQRLEELLNRPTADRLFQIYEAFQRGWSVDRVHRATSIDPWFLGNISEIVDFEATICEGNVRQAKQLGFSDQQIAARLGTPESAVRRLREAGGILPAYKLVDTCAAEFEARTPYYYSTYDAEDEARPSLRKKIMILGGGPNRIGQGIEFDYCCVHAAFALREIGYETIMVNSNPETVSTDYDISDKLYFEPLTREDVLNIVEREKPEGVIVQLGGQTPLTLAVGLEEAGVPIIGTSPDSIDRAEDRKRFAELVRTLGLRQPENGSAVEVKDALDIAHAIAYPVLVRPSYVLGGRAMEIVYDDSSLEHYMRRAVWASPERPVLIDRFIEDAIEVDVDMLSDGRTCVIGGIMEHIEEAGVHSGDAAMVLPPHTLPHWMIEEIRRYTRLLAMELHVVGLMNVQYAVKGKELYIIEVNPRASRTVPFVSKAIGVPLAKLAAKLMVGMTLAEVGFSQEVTPRHISVKESVLPFARFPGVDIILGPEMKSTGEVMGIDMDFGSAYCKSQLGALQNVPVSGTVFISVKDKDKTQQIVSVAHQLMHLGFSVASTSGTARFLRANGIEAEVVRRASEGAPNLLDLINAGRIQLIINSPSGKIPRQDEVSIRSIANARGVPVVTTMPGADAYAQGIRAFIRGELGVKPIQRYHVGSLLR
ncbi:MAG TPA: carbamoyl-phosphate synthase large subunit [Spirochaetia bacterium]|nr:carbamoyl-phosphate synthase large subunit [Spirochaetia bacterium]